jgi:hypothetical protein
MILSEWKTVWDTAVGVFAHEPIELQLAIGLSLAFMALMVVEGIRANFVPRQQTVHAPVAPPRPAAPPPVIEAAPVSHDEPVMLLAPTEPAQPRAPLPRKTVMVNRKRERARPLAFRPMRPKIQALRRELGEQSNA